MGERIEKFRSWWNGEPLPRAEGETGGAGTGGMTAPPRSASAGVTVAEAISLPMVYRAIQIHAISGKQLSIDTYRGPEQIDDHALTRRPDPFMSRSSWIEQNIVSLASTGNAYWEIIGDVLEPSALTVLNPLDMRIVPDSFGRVVGYTYRGREFKPSRIKHLTLLRVPGSLYGLGPIQAAQPDLRGALDTRDYAANWFTEGGMPGGVLKSEQHLSDENAAKAKDRWNETASLKNGVAVLGNGLEYQQVFLSPKDVQFIESQQFNVVTIARMFGTPASLMLAAVEGNSQTYANVEQDWLAYVRFTLMGYLVEIEDALSSVLPGKQQARFNIEALLRADTTTRYKSHQLAIQMGLYSDAYARLLERIPDEFAGTRSSKETPVEA